jgi:hypothetical protein
VEADVEPQADAAVKSERELDGNQRLNAFTIVVTPLSPPFAQDVMYFTFTGYEKQLAVSKLDGERIKTLLGGSPLGRSVVLEQAGDGKRMRVFVVQ